MLSEFSKRNRKRCESTKGFNHLLNSWTLSDWMTATVGELGEAANIIKKLNRHRDGVHEAIPEENLRKMLADELADAEIYLDLLFQAAGINREEAIEQKFRMKSAEIGYCEHVCMDGDGVVSHDFFYPVDGCMVCRKCGERSY